MQRGSRTGLAGLGLTALAVVGLGGCGAQRRAVRTGGGAQRHAVHTDGGGQRGRVAPLSAHAPASLVHGALPQVGTTQHVDAAGARLAVTLRRVIDPLRNSGAHLPPRTHAVAVIVQIRSSGPKVYDSSATGDVRLVASSGAATPVLATRGICRTPVDDFDRYITAGEDRVGCVVFAVANDATLDAVRFSPHAHRLGRLTWAP